MSVLVGLYLVLGIGFSSIWFKHSEARLSRTSSTYRRVVFVTMSLLWLPLVVFLIGYAIVYALTNSE